MHLGILNWPTSYLTRFMIGHKVLFGASMYVPFLNCTAEVTHMTLGKDASIWEGRGAIYRASHPCKTAMPDVLVLINNRAIFTSFDGTTELYTSALWPY